MAYMCMGCGEVYSWDMEVCPKASCEGDVVWIDELMIPIIKLLREKGYITEYCCSGHVYGNGCGAYVCLDDFMTEVLEDGEINQIKNNLPEMWTMEIDHLNRITFRHNIAYCYESEYDIQKYEDIVIANLAFLKFVAQLPWLEY